MDDAKRRSWEAQIARLRAATPDERLRAAADQRRVSTELLLAGLRERFPELDEEQIESKAGEIVFGASEWRSICERRRRRALGHREA
jgi:hypothetical protein